MQLKPNTLLQGGKYRIIRVLGQGGFGITYEAEQVLLRRTVALKEFFMKDCCERDEATSRVTVGTGSQRALVEKFRGKFIREAQMMASFNHRNIVRVIEVFEENDTAYYVMEDIPGGSLSEKVKEKGPLSGEEAEKYIRQVAEALDYVHARNTVHFDVKPSNILLNEADEAILVDFGISKHYDKAGEQTSSTPVGISKGFAPLEQSRDGDVSQFKPSTDIYALGATFYFLVSGKIPPEATLVLEEGLSRPSGVSDRLWGVISVAMRPLRKDRPQDISAFLALLDAAPGTDASPVKDLDEERTIMPGKAEAPAPKPKKEPESEKKPKPKPAPKEPVPRTSAPKQPGKWLWFLGVCAAAGLVILLLSMPKSMVRAARNEKPRYESLVDNCYKMIQDGNAGSSQILFASRDSLLPMIVEMEDKYSPFDSSYHQSHWLEAALMDKMEMVKDSLEELGKAQVLVSTSKAREFYELAAQMTSDSEERERLIGISNTFGVENGHDWVDLGLSVKWAAMNVGASVPSDYGYYFAWGETSTKNGFTQKNLKYCTYVSEFEYPKYSKYVLNEDSKVLGVDGSADNKTRLELSDDAARQNWGGKWRTPTISECRELHSKCSWTWISQGGTNGYIVTGKSGSSIFLPAAGLRIDESLRFNGSSCHYRSSSLFDGDSIDKSTDAWDLGFTSTSVFAGHGDRSLGLPVRPVLK